MAKSLKHLKQFGQHFLMNEKVVQKIIEAFQANYSNETNLLEIGLGDGVLTKYLKAYPNYKGVEIDKRWCNYLLEIYPELNNKIIQADFLKLPNNTLFNRPTFIIGNFPYNISSQIVFKVIDNYKHIPFVLGMFQKEVAERIHAKEGSKSYGILSVLTQHFYETELLFNIPPSDFKPPPKVWSSVLFMKRKVLINEVIDYKFFKQIVKLSFGQRRKTLRNSLKPLINNEAVKQLAIFNKRPEQLSLEAFYNLTNILS